MAEDKKQVRWLPLESNPEVLTKFLRKGGVPEPWNMTDVFGLDPDLLGMVPQPVKALVLLFPMTKCSEQFGADRAKELSVSDFPPELFYTNQTVSNACGTVALLHAVGNNVRELQLREEAVLSKFFKDTSAMNPKEKAAFMETYAPLADAHKQHAQEGNATETPSMEDEAEHHFIAFVHHSGSLWELDGRKPLPLNCGPSEPQQLLQDAAKECQKYMTADPDNVKFSVMAFTGGSFD